MRLVIAAVGSARGSVLADAIRRYEARAARYFRLQVLEVSAASLPDRQADRAREAEARSLLNAVPKDLELVALTRTGRQMRSRRLAAWLGELRTYGRPGLAFLLGGAHGLAPELLERARHRLSLSLMTLPHELARLVLAEQLYRAGTILGGEPYHKGP